ncbi:thiamine ABC transporter substrate-binding protein [Nocardioides halotolerans]|uniref:thiamine ABC transporter substrate-binding protein n=1 Tax=Nocardioides halotolerans TaxID=433660 RepID=UPI001FE119E5|nr:thiamine ABC transporter substrate-binding protein [Nocardioides halotolerans]
MAAALLTTSCSLVGDDDSGGDPAERVVLVTHESFVMSKDLQKQFEDESGFDLVVRAAGDAGALTNKLVLTKDDPTGDAVFGIDNTFGSRAIDEGVLAPYAADLPEGAEAYALEGDDDHDLTPVDTGNVCVNVDDGWFADHGIAEPQTLDDLAEPAYKDLFVTPGATTSSPGLAFLLTTIAAYGEDGWRDYWTRLLANGAEITQGWSDAYEVAFSQGGGGGDRPIVLSYDSSPAFTTDGEGGTTTSALLDTCFRQVEYAGVLAGADNPKGAEALVDFMLGHDFQAALPDAMYVFPVDGSVALPADWATFAKQPEHPYTVDPAEITANREAWLQQWSDLVSR